MATETTETTGSTDIAGACLVHFRGCCSLLEAIPLKSVPFGLTCFWPGGDGSCEGIPRSCISRPVAVREILAETGGTFVYNEQACCFT
jgi:hypothetical protein